jgi:UDP-N-acetylglucosamine 4,6-dehydratase
MRVLDVAEALAPDAERVITGIRPGEKIHEVLLTEDEARHSYDLGDRFVILPYRHEPADPRGAELPDGFRYSSDSNDRWLTADDFRAIAERIGPARRRADTVPSSG